MANASAKRQANQNAASLKQLRNISIFVYGSAFIFLIVARKRYVLSFLLSTPGFFAQYVLYAWCHPTFDERGRLVNPGHDIDQKGVTDYIKDIIIVFWVCIWLSMLAGLKAWLLLLLIPVYATYKGIGLLKVAKQLFMGPSNSASEANDMGAPPVLPEKGQRQHRKRV